MISREEREKAIASKITPEFMCTLIEVAKIYGHDGDFVAVRDFVRSVDVMGGHGTTGSWEQWRSCEPYPVED